MRLLLPSLCLLLAGCSSKKTSESRPADERAEVASKKRAGVRDVVLELMVLRQVRVEESSDKGALRLPASEMAKDVGRRLVTSGYLAAREGDVPDTHVPRPVEAFLSLSYDWAPDAEPGAGALVLAAEARLEFVDRRSDIAPRVAMLLEASVPMPSGTGDAAAQKMLERLGTTAAENLAESLAARERLRRAPHAELLSALSVSLEEPSLRIWGLQVAADRGLAEAAGAAVKSLGSEDEELRSAALSALVVFADPSTVAAITRGLDFNDYEELRVVMEAIQAIGGDDATSFLEFVASGHSDEGMRRRATEALERARERYRPTGREPEMP